MKRTPGRRLTTRWNAKRNAWIVISHAPGKTAAILGRFPTQPAARGYIDLLRELGACLACGADDGGHLPECPDRVRPARRRAANPSIDGLSIDRAGAGNRVIPGWRGNVEDALIGWGDTLRSKASAGKTPPAERRAALGGFLAALHILDMYALPPAYSRERDTFGIQDQIRGALRVLKSRPQENRGARAARRREFRRSTLGKMGAYGAETKRIAARAQRLEDFRAGVAEGQAPACPMELYRSKFSGQYERGAERMGMKDAGIKMPRAQKEPRPVWEILANPPARRAGVIYPQLVAVIARKRARATVPEDCKACGAPVGSDLYMHRYIERGKKTPPVPAEALKDGSVLLRRVSAPLWVN